MAGGKKKMTKSLFIKMQRDEESLERLLGTIRDKGCELVEMSAKRSLDNSYFFVHMSISGNGASEKIEHDLAALKDVSQIEVNTALAVGL